jgi:hypothetical protein
VAAAARAPLERAATERPSGQARQRGEQAIRIWKAMGWPEQEVAARQGRVIVCIDESGLAERPCRARTRALRGETAVLQCSFRWKQLSVIAGISCLRFYFRLFPGAIRNLCSMQRRSTLVRAFWRQAELF